MSAMRSDFQRPMRTVKLGPPSTEVEPLQLMHEEAFHLAETQQLIVQSENKV